MTPGETTLPEYIVPGSPFESKHSHWRRQNDNWGANIRIFVFTNCKNNRFQKKLIKQNAHIWIFAPPPPIIVMAAPLNIRSFLTINCTRGKEDIKCQQRRIMCYQIKNKIIAIIKFVDIRFCLKTFCLTILSKYCIIMSLFKGIQNTWQ